MEKTLSIIKPDGIRRDLTGQILSRIEGAGLKVVATKMIQMSLKNAQQFYAVHKDRPFYGELCETMTSGPVLVSVLQAPNAVAKHRELMGATDPSKADAHTLRKDFALSIGENTVHGSDSVENAAVEIAYFFAEGEFVNLSLEK